MSDSRSNILERLRRRQPALPQSVQQPSETAPDWSAAECTEQFCQRMQQVRAEIHPTTAATWVETLQQLCRDKGFGNLLYGADGPLAKALENGSGLPELVPFQQPMEVCKEQLFFEVDAAITSVRAGIAQTGSLLLWPTPQEPRSLSLVPPVHIALLHADSIVPTFAELLQSRYWEPQMPTNALLISGPSKTADIEQTLAYGIHGPIELLILLIT